MAKRARTGTIVDDAGAAVRLWTPWGLGKDSAPQELRERIEMVMQVSPGGVGAVAWGVTLLVAVVVTSMVSAAVLPAYWMSWGPIVLVAAGFFVIRRRMLVPRHAHVIRATMLSARHCASCGYDIAGSPADARGLSRCAECGARWRLGPGGASGPGDRLVWNRGFPGSMLERLGLIGILIRGTHSGVDDRQRAVEIVYPIPAHRLPSQWHTIPADERRRIEHRLRSLGMGTRVFVLFVAVYLVGRAVIGISADLAAGGSMLAIAPQLPLPLIIVMIVAFRLEHPVVMNKREIVEIMLGHGRCGSCAGDLSGVEADEQGIATCPHCGAGWRVKARRVMARGAEERRRVQESR